MWLTNAYKLILKRLRGAFKGKTFTLIIREPLSDKSEIRRIAVGPTLFGALKLDQVRRVGKVKADGHELGHGWPFYRPRPGEHIEVVPPTGAKAFTEAFIANLNADTGGSKILKAVIVTEDESTTRYFVDHDVSITFQGHVYEPLPMVWSDFEVDQAMNLPTLKVTVPNIGGEVINMVEKLDLLEHDVVLQMLQLDLLTGVTGTYDELLLQIQAIEGDDMTCIFTLGLNLAFTDVLPKNIILKSEFPGLIQTLTRFSA